MDWEDRLDEWETELELAAQLEGSDWVTLEKAAEQTGVSRAALRTWYRAGQIRRDWWMARTGRNVSSRWQWSPNTPRPRPGSGSPRNGA